MGREEDVYNLLRKPKGRGRLREEPSRPHTARDPRSGSRALRPRFELRTGETFRGGTLVAEGSAAHVFFYPQENTVQQCPDWFLPTVAKLEGRPEASFFPEDS